MLVTILLILMLQLQSFSRMAMVFLTAPLGLIGVVAALLVFQAPLGFVAILGVIALERHDHAQRGDPDRPGAERDGRGPRSVERRARSGGAPDPSGGADRAATVLAMVPLTHSVFWGPMAIAIMGGLTVATVLTIFFVPALYAAWFKVKRQPAPAQEAKEVVAGDPALA